MKNPKVARGLLILAAAVLMTTIVVIAVYADEPEQTKVHLDNWYVKGPAPDGPCSFNIDVHVTGVLQDKKWYDKSGNLEKEMIQYGGNKYDLYANGKSATVQNSGKTTITYPSPQQMQVTTSGQQWVWTIPGYGMISGEVGHESYLTTYDTDGQALGTVVLKLAGNTMTTDVTPILCGYLNP